MKKKKSAQGWMTLKIDLEKAYDRLSWEFIEDVQTTFGFNARWVNWVTKCISTTIMKLMINGSYYWDIKPKRGLRQGDHISLYVFILCTKILSRLLVNKVDAGDIHGLKLMRGGPRLHHLLFVDDIFLFGKLVKVKLDSLRKALTLSVHGWGLVLTPLSSTFSSVLIQESISLISLPL
ncbi:hypothetical protein UlMin_007008 [Ulmus minor]